MYLKVEHDGAEKVYTFPDNQEIKIGRSPDCEIQLLVEGISRYHLSIMSNDGEYFVVDQGSTNGSFINEDRLTVEEKVPFNTFFPVKLGFNVYLSLLDEVNVKELNKIVRVSASTDLNKGVSEKTKIPASGTNPRINLQRTNSRINTSQIKVSQTRQRQDNNFKFIVAFCLLGLGLYFSYGLWSPLFFEEEASPVAVIKPKAVNEVKKVVEKVASQDKLVISSLTKDKCLNGIEKTFCDLFEVSRERSYYEGFYYFIGNLYLTIFESTLTKSFSSFELEPIEKREIILIARRSDRKNFDIKKFSNVDKYRIKPTDEKLKLKSYLLLELLAKDYFKEIEKKPEIKKIIIALGKNTAGKVTLRDHLELTPSLYKDLIAKKADILKAIRFLMVSGYELPLKVKMKELGLEGF